MMRINRSLQIYEMNQILKIVFFILMMVISFDGIIANDELGGLIVLPKVIREAEEKVSESIVTIEGFGGILDSTIKGDGKVKSSVQGFSKPGEGPTTGIILDKEGHIVTSTFNFINKPKIITVTLKNGKKYKAQLLGRDFTRKICVLKINLNNEVLKVPEFISAKNVKVGQWAISVGVGFGGVENSISLGLISGKNRIFGKAIQTDANISPANYGGALMDVEGRIIGVCTPLSPVSAELLAGAEWYDSGIGFVIPLADITDILDTLKKNIDIQIGKIGIHPRVDRKDSKIVIIDLVFPDSPSEKAGLISGDIIVSIENIKVEGMFRLEQILGRFESGKTVSIEILRGKDTKTVSVTLATGSDAFKLESEKPIEKKKDLPND